MHVKISPSTLKRIRRFVATLFGSPPAGNGPDTDPYVGVREPKQRLEDVFRDSPLAYPSVWTVIDLRDAEHLTGYTGSYPMKRK
jgi:hypothetical protein